MATPWPLSHDADGPATRAVARPGYDAYRNITPRYLQAFQRSHGTARLDDILDAAPYSIYRVSRSLYRAAAARRLTENIRRRTGMA